MAQEVSHVSPITATGLVGIISIANGAGRFLWAWFSDVIGRKSVFVTMFLVQAAAFMLLSHVTSFVPLAILWFVTCFAMAAVRDHAGFCRGLLRFKRHRVNLRPHADGLGSGWSRWA